MYTFCCLFLCCTCLFSLPKYQQDQSSSNRREGCHSKPSLPWDLHWEEISIGGWAPLPSHSWHLLDIGFGLLHQAAGFCLLPAEVWVWPHRLLWVLLFAGQRLPGFARHSDTRQDLKSAQPCSGQGETKSALRCVFSSQSRAWGV